MLTTVTITEEINKKADEIRQQRGNWYPGYSCNCPFALALNEATKRSWSVANLNAGIIGTDIRITLPKEVIHWIDAWDDSRMLEIEIPFTVVLDIPELN